MQRLAVHVFDESFAVPNETLLIDRSVSEARALGTGVEQRSVSFDGSRYWRLVGANV